MSNLKKKWTLLFYLNGNNELEPEMIATMDKITNIARDKDINIIVQLARESTKTISIMRPQEIFLKGSDSWTGVRRYLICDNKKILLEDLGKINMADPLILQEFITWGISNYPAENILVSISSHGFSVASLPDLSGDEPYVMGSYEMCNAIRNSSIKTGQVIDILILDICYMNNIEIMYELGRDSKKLINRVITYKEDGPIAGLDYCDIVPQICGERFRWRLNRLLDSIAKSNKHNLIIVQLNYKVLFKIKKIADKLGALQLENNIYIEKMELYKNKLIKLFNKLIIGASDKDNHKNLIIIDRDLYSVENREEFIKYYLKLSFCKNNKFSNYVAMEWNKAEKKDNGEFMKYKLTRRNISSFIRVFNFNLTFHEVEKIIDNLYKFKGWKE